MSCTARYTVKFVAGERRGSFLIPLSSTQPCSALIDAVKDRLSGLKDQQNIKDIKRTDATLHLEDADGPMLYAEDALQDVLPGAKEIVVVVFESINTITANHPHQLKGSLSLGVPSLKIRVINPEQARNSRDIRPLRDAIPLSCTLTDLKARVQTHLGLPADDGTCLDLECNCQLAQEIDDHAVLREHGAEDHEAASTAILIHGNRNILALPVDGLHQTHLQKAAQGLVQSNKVLTLIGGVEAPMQSGNNKQYIKAPILTICSKRKHAAPRSTAGCTATGGRELVVDLHTSECPIEVTENNANVTLADAGIEDCAIDGVLTVYVVQRWEDPQEETAQGKAGIFQKSAAWEHPNGQTDRGISSLLSTLRVFTDLTSGSDMEEEQQDAILHIIHLLTQFPPAVRASYILMRGETPLSAERAALAQSLYEVLKSVVPLRVVGSDPSRFLEGSRLLFGLILEKAKNLKITEAEHITELPYVGMDVHDLRNLITMEPVLSVPTQTKSGLLDLGIFKAFEQGGLLRWTNDNNTAKSSTFDGAWSRMAALAGGKKARVVRFDSDAVNTNTRYADAGDVNKVIAASEYCELSYLAGLCAQNRLSVIPPSALPSATPPVLTLDREGWLAVFIGRAGCSEPGSDILLFSPTSSSEEDGVDVSIITQVLEPILAQRKADGTEIFEAYGDQHRKLVSPDEVAVICVDLSRSMLDRCGFIDVQDNEDADAQIERDQGAAPSTAMTENPAFHLPDADELKEYMRNHESFEDFLAITHAGTSDYQRRLNAEKVLNILQQIDNMQIEAKTKKLEELRERTSHYNYRTQAKSVELELNTVKNRSLRLKAYTGLICAWLLTCQGTQDVTADPLAWRPGQPIPQIPNRSQQGGPTGPNFEIPREFCCHISSEIMEDPVVTEDNFTYDRKNIERWFQTNETSPLTNLVLPTLNLTPNVRLREIITQYSSGEDITSRYRILRGDSHLMVVSLKSPLHTWSLHLPRKLKLSELWELAFRLTKGRYSRFELQHRNASLPLSELTIDTALTPDHMVFITPAESQAVATANPVNMQEICLVKVFDSSARMIVSYWEPMTTTRSLGSSVFKYYRAKFAKHPSTPVGTPFVLWTGLKYSGDGYVTGTVIDGPWETLSQYFNANMSTGILTEEIDIDITSDEETDVCASTGSNINQTLVFKLTIGGSPSSKKTARNRLSRLDVLKQMFDAFVNRLLAYNLQTHIGLVTFGSTASIAQPITNAVENFRHKLNNMRASGDTAIWDSIALGQDQLQTYAKKYPTAKLRIICISDGEDNTSQQCKTIVASKLCQQKVILDSFCLGNAVHEDLQTMSFLTKGSTFEPKTLEEAMAICELEPVLSVLDRPEAANNRYRDAFRAIPTIGSFNRAGMEVSVERVTQDVFPKRKEHPQLGDGFVELGTFNKQSTQDRTNGNLRLSRIQTEIRNSGAHTHAHYDIYINESNMAFWKVVMQGPPESTYAGGTFLLYIDMGADYPMFAPTARFVTPIYHPNINRHGRICHSILDRNWTVDTSNKDLLDTIYSLLLVPEFSDPINTVVTLNYHWDEVQFKEEAQRHIQKHASKSRTEWRAEIVG